MFDGLERHERHKVNSVAKGRWAVEFAHGELKLAITEREGLDACELAILKKVVKIVIIKVGRAGARTDPLPSQHLLMGGAQVARTN